MKIVIGMVGMFFTGKNIV